MSAPYTMLCCNLGDLWKLFPDGRCCPIEDEDDLRDPKKIDALEPSPDSLKRLLSAKDGEVIAWAKCGECSGTGQFRGACVCVKDYDDDHGPYTLTLRPWDRGETLAYGEFVDEDRTCPCVECKATGRVAIWTGERVLIAALVGPERAA